ncbi:hypothetical protein EDB81DRAFT_952865 [Dactylonectria macrodidyma]|uniref:Cellobiose dehydrogenase n=1 Tax=Dactylonectria macrodidyma TaxID=307937 RepID=A0A9P9IE37_9HYPO|nr:hypothetical protein EDB81DRAFT_952865 [Dactylonectria macrodidyma]
MARFPSELDLCCMTLSEMAFENNVASVAYTDSASGIAFQKWSDASTDFMGQISAPITEGYAALALRTSMASSLFIVAWPNGESVVSSLREATGYTNPDVLDDDTVSLKTIETGTSVNDAAFTYTFLCSGCIKTDGSTFSSTGTSASLGWALSTTALDSPSSASGVLNYHSAGFGGFGLGLFSAQSSDYETWAALASDDSSTTPDTGSGEGTVPSNFTTIISNVTYDYIVGGAGAAGLIVAERLAESGASVLLLERGEASLYSSGGDVTGLERNRHPYYGDTASQTGYILGGSTAINAMMFVKPNSEDFENWPAGWQRDTVEASASDLYERTPGTTSPTKHGELHDQGAWNILSTWLDGNGFTEVNNGLRAGPVPKVLRAVRNGSTVTGVEVSTGAATRHIINLNANGAAILGPGASPPPTPVPPLTAITLPASADWIDLPVGENLQGHPIFTANQQTTDSLSSLASTDFTAQTRPTSTSSLRATVFSPKSGQRLNFWTSTTNTMDGVERFIKGTCNSPANDTVRLKVYLTHGLTSTGTLGITSAGATKLIKKPYLNTDGDKEATLAFLNQLIPYATASGSTLSIASNTTAESLVAEYVTGSHFVRTAKMGTSNDGTGVVDASIHSELPTGNTQAIVMVAAAHAAKKFLLDWRLF